MDNMLHGKGGRSNVSQVNENEPKTVEELSQAYDVESTFASRKPTMTFVLTTGQHKGGVTTSTRPDQVLKLFVQASADVEYSVKDFLISHLNGAFLSKKKAKELSDAGRSLLWDRCVWILLVCFMCCFEHVQPLTPNYKFYFHSKGWLGRMLL
jgi:hypothetical protein